jgi:hypothetical protein
VCVLMSVRTMRSIALFFAVFAGLAVVQAIVSDEADLRIWWACTFVLSLVNVFCWGFAWTRKANLARRRKR